jgi:hypothetical protein
MKQAYLRLGFPSIPSRKDDRIFAPERYFLLLWLVSTMFSQDIVETYKGCKSILAIPRSPMIKRILLKLIIPLSLRFSQSDPPFSRFDSC